MRKPNRSDSPPTPSRWVSRYQPTRTGIAVKATGCRRRRQRRASSDVDVRPVGAHRDADGVFEAHHPVDAVHLRFHEREEPGRGIARKDTDRVAVEAGDVEVRLVRREREELRTQDVVHAADHGVRGLDQREAARDGVTLKHQDVVAVVAGS
jgi:hypothetical protein